MKLSRLTVVLALLPTMAFAEPVRLKLAFLSSDRSDVYAACVRPFVDAVNSQGADLIDIDVAFSGALEKAPDKQAALVDDGAADIAFIVPGYSPERFPDNDVLQLPGLFADTREATLLFNKLVAAHALRGYDDFVVLGSCMMEPETIHSRKPVSSIGDLRGLKVRVNNRMQAAALEKLGAIPVALPITRASQAISSGAVDGSTASPIVVREFGIGRVAANHFLLKTSAVTLPLVMSRKKFDSLSPEAQALIRKYSGDWLAERAIKSLDLLNEEMLEVLKANPRRKVVVPSPPDEQTARIAFQSVIDQWAAGGERQRKLLATLKSELASIRASQ